MDLIERDVRGMQESFRSQQKPCTDRCKRDASSVSVKQRGPKLQLKRTNLATECRLRHVEQLGCLGKTAQLRDLHEKL